MGRRLGEVLSLDGQAAQLSRKERAALGRAARESMPIDTHGDIGPVEGPGQREKLDQRTSPGQRDPIRLLEEQARSRLPELLGIRYQRMASSPFAFYRGAAAIMANDLRSMPDSGILTQLCGDAHLDNIGFYASPERALVADVNDFDETATGPFEWDLKRMAASFEIAARARGFDDRERERIVGELVTAYGAAMRTAARTPIMALFSDHVNVDQVLQQLRDRLPKAVLKRAGKSVTRTRSRNSRQAARSLMTEDDGTLRFRSQPPLLTPLRELAERVGWSERESTDRLSEILERYRESLPPQKRLILARYRMVDAAMKVVGVGSVGTRSWLVLLRGNGKKDLLMLQAKEAGRSVLEPPEVDSGYRHQGQRVVEGQQIMQSLSDVLLGWTSATGFDGTERDFYVRQFRDWKGSADPDVMEPETMRIYAEYCGAVLAAAHARGGDAATIAGYLGDPGECVPAFTQFAAGYADRNEQDYAALTGAIARGEIAVNA